MKAKFFFIRLLFMTFIISCVPVTTKTGILEKGQNSFRYTDPIGNILNISFKGCARFYFDDRLTFCNFSMKVENKSTITILLENSDYIAELDDGSRVGAATFGGPILQLKPDGTTENPVLNRETDFSVGFVIPKSVKKIRILEFDKRVTGLNFLDITIQGNQ
jgi:hypothetical protein